MLSKCQNAFLMKTVINRITQNSKHRLFFSENSQKGRHLDESGMGMGATVVSPLSTESTRMILRTMQLASKQQNLDSKCGQEWSSLPQVWDSCEQGFGQILNTVKRVGRNKNFPSAEVPPTSHPRQREGECTPFRKKKHVFHPSISLLLALAKQRFFRTTLLVDEVCSFYAFRICWTTSTLESRT